MDKIDRLFDAVEHPERYTSAELREMLRDPEVKETFDLLDKMKSSLQPLQSPDIEKEWERFNKNHHAPSPVRGFRLSDLFSRKIAASIAIGILSVTTVAAIVGIGVNHYHSQAPSCLTTTEIAATQTLTTEPDSVRTTESNVPADCKTIVFDNEQFGTIITKIAKHYGYEADFKTDKSKSLRLYYRWNQALAVEDVVKSLNNFEQISLSIKDNTIKID